MRAIKFRAWHKQEKKMSHWGSGVITIDHQLNVSTVPYPKTLKHEDIELMQFTGLPDKQGKDIYEGDIVHCHAHHTKFIVKWCDSKGEWLGAPVGWILNDGYYTTEFEASTKHPSEHDYEYADVTILGNIYEHPDLLKDVGSFGYDPITGEQKQS